MKTAIKAGNIEKLPARAWLIVWLLCVVGLLNYLDRSMITTMRLSITADMPMTDAQFGLLTSVFLWTYGILSPFAGYLADRFNRSRVIIISLLVWSSLTWLTAYSQTFEQLLISRALMGISEACYIPAALALITDYHKGRTRSLATGIHMAGVMAGQTLGFVGGWIAEKHTWSSSFIVTGIVGVLFSFLLVFFLKDVPQAAAEKKPQQHSAGISFVQAIKDLFGNRAFILVLAYWGLLGVVSWLIMGWLPTFYKERFNVSQTVAGVYATGYLYPAALAGALIGGFWADRWSITNSAARIYVPLIGLCTAAPCIFIASSTGILPLTIVFFMIYALARSFCDANMMPILCTVANARYLATGYGILNLFACIVGGISLYAGGYLRDAHIRLGFIYQVAAFTLVLCAALLFMAARIKKKATG